MVGLVKIDFGGLFLLGKSCSHRLILSAQESASFVPRDRFFSERMEESPQIITLNYILIAADFPA